MVAWHASEHKILLCLFFSPFILHDLAKKKHIVIILLHYDFYIYPAQNNKDSITNRNINF